MFSYIYFYKTIFVTFDTFLFFTVITATFISDQSQRGSLFTLFLYCPLMAFLSVCGLSNVRQVLWEKAQEFLRKVYRDIGQMMTRSRTIGISQLCECYFIHACVNIYMHVYIHLYIHLNTVCEMCLKYLI